jgi:hypothetical protein
MKETRIAAWAGRTEESYLLVINKLAEICVVFFELPAR